MPVAIKTPPLFPDVHILIPERFTDHRGYFSEIYSQPAFQSLGIDCTFVQDNQSLSVAKGTVRGLHFQYPPYDQAKLVRVTSGRLLDVIVDIRAGSPSFGQHFSIELSAENRQQLFIPSGFAHGFCTLEDNTEILYKVSAPYSKAHDAGIFWNDPDLNIAWPVLPTDAVLSDKDLALPLLKNLSRPFSKNSGDTP